MKPFLPLRFIPWSTFPYSNIWLIPPWLKYLVHRIWSFFYPLSPLLVSTRWTTILFQLLGEGGNERVCVKKRYSNFLIFIVDDGINTLAPGNFLTRWWKKEDPRPLFYGVTKSQSTWPTRPPRIPLPLLSPCAQPTSQPMGDTDQPGDQKNSRPLTLLLTRPTRARPLYWRGKRVGRASVLSVEAKRGVRLVFSKVLVQMLRNNTIFLFHIFHSVTEILIKERKQVKSKSTFKNNDLVSYEFYYYILEICYAMLLSAYLFCTTHYLSNYVSPILLRIIIRSPNIHSLLNLPVEL